MSTHVTVTDSPDDGSLAFAATKSAVLAIRDDLARIPSGERSEAAHTLLRLIQMIHPSADEQR